MDKISLIIIVAAFFIINFLISVSIKNKTLANIRDSWGKLPSLNRKKYPEKFLRSAFISYIRQKPSVNLIDDITWKDLDMVEVFKKINITRSSIGAEALYRRLRITDAKAEDQAYIESLISYFEKNPQDREAVQYVFSKIGRLDDNGVLEFIRLKKDKRLYNTWVHIIFALIPLVSIILIAIQYSLKKLLFLGPFPLFILIAVVTYNLVYSNKMRQGLENDYKMANYLSSSIHYGKKILIYDLPIEDQLSQAFKPVRSLGKYSFLGFSEIKTTFALLNYVLNAIFRISFITFARSINIIEAKRSELLELWSLLGDVEASISILNYKLASNYTTKANFIDQHQIIGKEVYHPLLSRPVANDLSWTNISLVTGSNASGKSTYVKSVAINAILAQTIYLCHAKAFAMKKGNVLSSMAIKDNVIEGDSYFIAEIKSLKRIIANIDKKSEDYYFIDEILKGTNTIERIAASSSIISYLLEKKQLAFIASHDIELTKIFDRRVKNIHFRESVDEKNGISFDYKLHLGPSTSKNAIKLLDHMNFPKAIIEEAQSRTEKFEKESLWI
ncbi:MAG: hypothetical protein Q4E50_05815 [Tissierellia bacterium]|nr:hypothetical protein [Tissierellia bacterium]